MGSNYQLSTVIVILAVAIGSWLGTAIVRQLAWRYDWVAPSRPDRWHKKPTALLGGLGFYPVFLVGILFIVIFNTRDPLWQWGALKEMSIAVRLTMALLAGSLVMFILGTIDDFKPIRPLTKLLCQLAAASIFIFSDGVFNLTNIYIIDILITYFWFIGIINAFNLLDNLDGLASGVAILAGATLVIISWVSSSVGTELVLAVPIGLVFIGAIFGFWLHNLPPASIFMGDAGSLFIGFVLAALAIPSALNGFMGITTAGSPLVSAMVILIPATVLAIPIFDTTLVTLTRTIRAQSVFDGGQDHSSHRLVGLGISEKRAVWLMYCVAAFGGLVAILMQQYSDISLLLFGIFAFAIVIFGVYLGQIKV